MPKTIRLGLIGHGCRGRDLLKDTILPMNRVMVTAVCDTYEDRAAAAADKVEEVTGVRPFSTTDYREAIARADVDAVVIAAAWEAHVDVAVAAMEAGKYVGLEVGGAYSIEDCWRLVRTKEIGILRSIGASKRDISRVFNAETLIVGFTAGVIGIGFTLLVCIPINIIIRTLTGIPTIGAILPWKAAVILVGISMLLTFIAGLFPSRVAAKKDPVVALRTE